MEEKAFTWVEVETVQAGYLLQVTSELVARLNDRLQKSDQTRTCWTRSSPKKKKLTWKLFKEEMFGRAKNDDQEPCFDNLEEIDSSGEEDEVAIANIETKPNKLSKKAGAYLL